MKARWKRFRLISRRVLGLWSNAKKINRLLVTRVFKDALSLLIAAAFGAYLSGLTGLQATTAPALLPILLILSALVWCLAISVLFELSKAVQTARNYNVSINRDYHIGNDIQSSAFSLCAAEALKAKKSIIVMGPHFDRDRDRDNDLVAGTTSHSQYLENSMNAAVERHINSIDSDFRYERIVQVDPDIFPDIVNGSGEIEPESFENKSLASHVKHVLHLSKRSHTVEVIISVIPYVPSFPSILVIDDKFVFFSLPTGISAESGRKSSSKRTKPKINFDLVLGIEDNSTEIPVLFRQIILQFKRGSRQITDVVDEIDGKIDSKSADDYDI